MEDREYKLKEKIDSQKDKYDYIIIDCPPSLGLITLNAFTASDSVLIPVQCEYFALEGMNQLLNTVRLVKKHLNPSIEIEGVLLTMCMRNKLAQDVEKNVRSLFKSAVFDTKIPRNIRLAEAPSFAKTINNYDDKCAGALAYKALAQEFISKHKE